jgi:hypothetical protein
MYSDSANQIYAIIQTKHFVLGYLYLGLDKAEFDTHFFPKDLLFLSLHFLQLRIIFSEALLLFWCNATKDTWKKEGWLKLLSE